jgi:hypothetical protein
MKFIKHIFTGSLILFTLVFNFIFPYMFWFLIFRPEYVYEGMTGPAAIIGIGIYSMYWAYCIKTFREGTK